MELVCYVFLYIELIKAYKGACGCLSFRMFQPMTFCTDFD
jgi:hypothetical protein